MVEEEEEAMLTEVNGLYNNVFHSSVLMWSSPMPKEKGGIDFLLFPVGDLEIHSYTVRTTEKRYGEVTAKPRRSIGMVRCSKKEEISCNLCSLRTDH